MHRARTYPRPATNHDAVSWDTFEKAPCCKWDWDTPHLKKNTRIPKTYQRMDGLERCAFCLFSSLAGFFSNGVANLLFTETTQTAPQHGSMVFSHPISPILNVIWWQGHCTPEQWSQDNGHYNILLPSEKSFWGWKKIAAKKSSRMGLTRKKQEEETTTVWAQNFQG